jgi:hypothetical protein
VCSLLWNGLPIDCDWSIKKMNNPGLRRLISGREALAIRVAPLSSMRDTEQDYLSGDLVASTMRHQVADIRAGSHREPNGC